MNEDEWVASIAEANGRLYQIADFVLWYPDDDRISLDGSFTIAELEAIIAHVKRHSRPSQKHEGNAKGDAE